MRPLRIHSLCIFANLFLFALSGAQQDNIFNQEEPTSPPTAEYQGPESGYIVPIPEGNGPQVNQDRVVDFSYCYGALASQDINNDQRIERAEFENFAQDFGSATECLGPLKEIPLELILVWNQLSCECRVRGGGPQCCLGNNANIPITGVGANDQIIVEEQQFLRQVCLRTDQAIATYCKPPPPPIIPPPPQAVVFTKFNTNFDDPLITGIIIAGIFFLLPWRRRCFFRQVYREYDESDDDSEDGGGMRHLITEMGGEDDGPSIPAPLLVPPRRSDVSIIEEFIDEPIDDESVEEVTIVDEDETHESYIEEVIEDEDYGEPDDTAMLLQSTGEEEHGAYGGTSYGRTIELPEYEEEGDPFSSVYEQYETQQEPEIPIELRPIPTHTLSTEEDPYDLEHYVPDGGVVQYEREGAWRYDADGGWVRDERPSKQTDGVYRTPYKRAAAVTSTPDSLLRQRRLEAYGGGEIFDLLDHDPSQGQGSWSNRGFNWVIQNTLNTLDQRAGSIQASNHSSSGSSEKESEFIRPWDL